jgi:hypothetical protein
VVEKLDVHVPLEKMGVGGEWSSNAAAGEDAWLREAYLKNPEGGIGKQNNNTGQGQLLHGKWRHPDYIAATHNQVDVHVFENRPHWNIITIEGLHATLRCGNKDRDRLILAARFLGVANYDEVLKAINPRLSPFGVMGSA